MAENEQKETAKKADPKPDAAVQKSEAMLFAPSTLIARSDLFLGHEAHIAAGALSGIEDDISIDAAKAKISEWLNKPVKEA